MIERNKYLNQLISKKENGLVKVITGLRRSGKSYLLFNIFKSYLLSNDVSSDHIISIALDDIEMQRYWNPNELNTYIRNKIINDGKTNYIFIDEIQFVKEVDNPYLSNSKIGFNDVILGLMKIDNIDIYITGSNSEMLSNDILTKFRGRSDQIHVMPLSFSEFYNYCKKDKNDAWNEYILFGGMPYILSLNSYEDKSLYLKNLFNETYIKDIIERENIKNSKSIIDDLLYMLSSSVGSLTNPLKIVNTFKSLKNISINSLTINNYLNYLLDSFLIEKAERYDIKGKKYISTPKKYYFSDIGLRNVLLNFTDIEEAHIMENIIYNELIYRGYNVDVGVIESFYKDENKTTKRSQYEIDFVCNKANNKCYIQVAYALPDKEKRRQEVRGFNLIKDSFKKIVIIKDNIIPRRDENGILYVGIIDFLLNDQYLLN